MKRQQGMMQRGGRRKGAGRPKGSGRWGEPTVPMRVPTHLLAGIAKLIQNKGRKLPLLVVGKPSEASMSGNA